MYLVIFLLLYVEIEDYWYQTKCLWCRLSFVNPSGRRDWHCIVSYSSYPVLQTLKTAGFAQAICHIWFWIFHFAWNFPLYPDNWRGKAQQIQFALVKVDLTFLCEWMKVAMSVCNTKIKSMTVCSNTYAVKRATKQTIQCLSTGKTFLQSSKCKSFTKMSAKMLEN